MSLKYPIPVIDIFAGPGGLSEGFASIRRPDGRRAFDIALSIEKDPYAHCTLELRAFFQHLSETGQSDDYYKYLWGPEHPEGIDRVTLFKRHQKSQAVAKARAWHQELSPDTRAAVSTRIRKTLANFSPDVPWVLLGGPPCQAYSVAGRSRMKSVLGEEFEEDHRHKLYEEYLAILKAHKPHVFVMENVKGLLSSEVRSVKTFDLLLSDLCNAAGKASYKLFSFIKAKRNNRSVKLFRNDIYEPDDFLIECENFGIPQARHRLIILGIRSDLLHSMPDYDPPTLNQKNERVSIGRVLKGLPRLRSGISRTDDIPELWRSIIHDAGQAGWLKQLNGSKGPLIRKKIISTVQSVRLPHADRGARFLAHDQVYIEYAPRWYLDPHIRGVCNHETKSHMPSDIHRYLFASCYAAVKISDQRAA